MNQSLCDTEHMTNKLGELATLIRSKNAGPFMLTFDIMFDDPDIYARVRDANVITREVIAKLYSRPPGSVDIYWVDAALAGKVSFPRPVVQGSLEDTDTHGGQQFCQLLDIEVP